MDSEDEVPLIGSMGQGSGRVEGRRAVRSGQVVGTSSRSSPAELLENFLAGGEQSAGGAPSTA